MYSTKYIIREIPINDDMEVITEVQERLVKGMQRQLERDIFGRLTGIIDVEYTEVKNDIFYEKR